jgi:2-polyprenyl-3-methyl-5-hydroxy-6-metoxy-1,4-benzoquinol methylase
MKIGPATGTMLYVLRQHGHRVLGCDVSNQFAEYARSNYRVEIEQGRFEKKSYEDGRFDITLLFNVIENVPNQVEFLKAVHRTLKDGGCLSSICRYAQ